MNVICVYGISVFTLQSVSLIHTQVNIGSKQRKRNGLFSYIAGTLKYLVREYARLFHPAFLFNTSYLRVEAMQWYTVNNYSPL